VLQLRVEGDPAEARVFLDALAAAGAEVQIGTTKDRGGFVHVYAVIRMPGYQAPDAPRVATTSRAAAVPPSGRRALRGRRR
jgi:hypothetical protein